MKPTFLKVGIPKSKTRAPATVKPPTESTDATLGGDIGIYETDDGTGTTHSWVLPANAQEGDLCFIALQNESSDISTIPAGWTELLNNPAGDCSEQLYAKILEADDIAGGETFTITGSEESSTLSWYVRNTTTTPATVDVSSDSGTHDPPAVTITQGAGDYIVFPVWWANKGNFPTDQATDGPSGYTVLGAADTGGGVLAPAVYAWYANKTISTSEDPGDIAWSDSAGSRSYACVTIAVKRTQTAPLATGDHTHTLTDDDITDIDVTTTAPVVGDLLRYDGTDWIPALIDRYVATADKTVANTTTETTLFGTGEGSLTLPANYLRTGRTIKIDIRGRLAATGNPNRTIKLKLGSTVITSLGPTAIASVSGTVEFRIQLLLTCRAAGASGTVIAGGVWSHSNGTFRSLSSGSTATVDTTGTLAVDVTWQWGTASASNTITAKEAVVT